MTETSYRLILKTGDRVESVVNMLNADEARKAIDDWVKQGEAYNASCHPPLPGSIDPSVSFTGSFNKYTSYCSYVAALSVGTLIVVADSLESAQAHVEGLIEATSNLLDEPVIIQSIVKSMPVHMVLDHGSIIYTCMTPALMASIVTPLPPAA